MAAHEVTDEIRRNFHLFCDNFPFPVLLVHKDRTILEMNAAAKASGYYETVSRCVDVGLKEHHKACLANHALKEKTAKRLVAYFDFAGRVLDSYWIPLAGSEDMYLHFAADITEWASETLKEKSCDAAAADCSGCNCG